MALVFAAGFMVARPDAIQLAYERLEKLMEPQAPKQPVEKAMATPAVSESKAAPVKPAEEDRRVQAEQMIQELKAIHSNMVTIRANALERLAKKQSQRFSAVFTKRPFGLTLWRDIHNNNCIITNSTDRRVNGDCSLMISAVQGVSCKHLPHVKIISMIKNGGLPMTLEFSRLETKMAPLPRRKAVCIWSSSEMNPDVKPRLEFLTEKDAHGFREFKIPGPGYYCMLTGKRNLTPGSKAFGCHRTFADSKPLYYENHGCSWEAVLQAGNGDVTLGKLRCKQMLMDIKNGKRQNALYANRAVKASQVGPQRSD